MLPKSKAENTLKKKKTEKRSNKREKCTPTTIRNLNVEKEKRKKKGHK